MLEVTFSGQDNIDEYTAGTVECLGIYMRLPGKPFELQTAYSDSMQKVKMPNVAFKALAAIGDASPSNEELIKLDMSGLTEIATGKSTGAKNWLRQLLNHSQNTPEVQKLKTLLR